MKTIDLWQKDRRNFERRQEQQQEHREEVREDLKYLTPEELEEKRIELLNSLQEDISSGNPDETSVNKGLEELTQVEAAWVTAYERRLNRLRREALENLEIAGLTAH